MFLDSFINNDWCQAQGNDSCPVKTFECLKQALARILWSTKEKDYAIYDRIRWSLIGWKSNYTVAYWDHTLKGKYENFTKCFAATAAYASVTKKILFLHLYFPTCKIVFSQGKYIGHPGGTSKGLNQLWGKSQTLMILIWGLINL